jgi:hypothetical protein
MDDAIEGIGQVEGVRLSELPPLSTILVWTRNSLYRLVVLDASEIYVQGGALFPHLTSAQLDGASIGRGFLMTGCICVGLLMELRVAGTRVRTSPVVAISAEPVQHRVVH